MAQDAFPEGIHMLAHIIDMDARNIFVEKQLKRYRGAASIRLDIFAIEQPILFHQSLDVSRQLRLPAWISKWSEVKKPLQARKSGFVHGQIFSNSGWPLSQAA